MTSNLGAEFLLQTLSMQKDKEHSGITDVVKERVFGEVRKHFRPEFINRLDDMVVFTPLSKAHLREIIILQLHDLEKRLVDRDINLRLNDDAFELILEKAYDPAFGARPLGRYIEKTFGTELSRLIISEKLTEHMYVTIKRSGDSFKYSLKRKTVDEQTADAHRMKKKRKGSKDGEQSGSTIDFLKKGFLVNSEGGDSDMSDV